MDPQSITKDMIPQPQLWRLVMEIDADRIEVAMHPPVATERVIYTSLMLNPDAPSHEKAVQEAIYANPVVLSDFKGVDVVFDTDSAMFVPGQLLDKVGAEPLYAAGAGCGEVSGSGKVLSDGLPGGISAVYAVDKGLYGFIRRTFFNVAVRHRLSPIVAKAMNTPGLHAVVEPGRLDLIAISPTGLMLAHTVRYRSPQDATYYIIATRKSVELGDTPLLIAGYGPEAEQICGYVERYCGPVTRPGLPEIGAVMQRDAAAMPQSISAILSCE